MPLEIQIERKRSRIERKRVPLGYLHWLQHYTGEGRGEKTTNQSTDKEEGGGGWK